MTHQIQNLQFTINDIQQSAQWMLDSRPDEVVAWRLLKDVLRLPGGDAQLRLAKKIALEGKWVQQLIQSQLPDGSWGRFHSQDTKQKTVFRTTEEAIDRAFTLGLEPGEPPLSGVQQYITRVLNGEKRITDRDEKSEAWSLGIGLILAGRLAQINPADQLLDVRWAFLSDVAGQAFASGSYRLEDEVKAFKKLSGIHAPGGFLESQHMLWILSSHPLPESLDRALTRWLWHKPDGIRYQRVPLNHPEPRQSGTWLRSMSILSKFATWKEVSAEKLNQLWNMRGEDGLWDFGSRMAKTVDFPLSDNWRRSMDRKLDFSTGILCLLRKCFD